jgi:outer membrane protein TolC
MRQAEAEYRFQQLRRDIIKALLTTAFAQRIVEVGEQDLAWLQSTAKTVENKYRAGQAVVADTLQIQNEVARHADALRTQRRQFGHERLTLNRLLNRDVESAWPSLQLPPVAPAISFSEKLLSLALQNEPRLKVLEQEIKQAEASAALSRNSRLPDVSLGIEGRQYSGDGGFRSGMFVLRTSLPWVNRDRYRREYEREKEKQHSAEQERAEQVLMLKEQLHHLVVGIEATRREALLHRDEITTRATQALSSRLADWESGRGAFRDVLDARRTLLESQLLSARAISDQNQMMAELLLWTGLENFEALARLASEPPLLPEPDNPN